MRKQPTLEIERHRITFGEFASYRKSLHGAFHWGPLRIISSGSPERGNVEEGWPWEHVSVSCDQRIPTWDEMCKVKEAFWLPTETVIQFHPSKTVYVNFHPFCLHLWRNVETEIPTPPIELIGPK